MSTVTTINTTNYKNHTKFTIDNNLQLDNDMIFVENLSASDKVKAERYKTLANKTYLTADENTEYENLQEYFKPNRPTIDLLNDLQCRVFGLQVFIKEDITTYTEEQKQEVINLINNYRSMGEYSPIVSYKLGNMVIYDGFGFISRVNDNLGHTPNKDVISDDYWFTLTIKGDKGDPSLNITIKKNSTGGAEWDNSITYMCGDACVYNGYLYYCLVDGTLNINPTDTTHWKCAERIWISSTAPVDKNLIWWDTGIDNAFKRWDNSAWIEQNVSAPYVNVIDRDNLYIASDAEGCFAEVKNGLNTEISERKLADTDIYNKITTINTNITNLFTSGNDYRQKLADNLIAKGVSASASEPMSSLIAKILMISSGDGSPSWSYVGQYTITGATIPTIDDNYILQRNNIVYFSRDVGLYGTIYSLNLDTMVVSYVNKLTYKISTLKYTPKAFILNNYIYYGNTKFDMNWNQVSPTVENSYYNGSRYFTDASGTDLCRFRQGGIDVNGTIYYVNTSIAGTGGVYLPFKVGNYLFYNRSTHSYKIDITTNTTTESGLFNMNTEDGAVYANGKLFYASTRDANSSDASVNYADLYCVDTNVNINNFYGMSNSYVRIQFRNYINNGKTIPINGSEVGGTNFGYVHDGNQLSVTWRKDMAGTFIIADSNYIYTLSGTTMYKYRV